MEYLLDYFHWDLVHKFNEDKPEDEQYNGTDYNDKFMQFAIDELNYLFQKDLRGYFFESWNEANYSAAGIYGKWVQDNESFSSYGVVRGLHYQA